MSIEFSLIYDPIQHTYNPVDIAMFVKAESSLEPLDWGEDAPGRPPGALGSHYVSTTFRKLIILFTR